MPFRRAGAGALALWLLIGGTLLAATAVRRASMPLALLRGGLAVEGVITEKQLQWDDDRLIPVAVPVYVIRYAYPTPGGQMRTGEQRVTRHFYAQSGEQGAPARILVESTNPAVSAIEARLTFPGAAGLRLALGLAAMAAAYLVLLFGVLPPARGR